MKRFISSLLTVVIFCVLSVTAQGQEQPLTLTVTTKGSAQQRDVEGWMQSANFIVGIYYAEDIIQIPGTRWIIASGLATQGPGMHYRYTKGNYLHLLDAETETGRAIQGEEYRIAPDTARFPDTTTPPNWDVFSPHGVGLSAREGDSVTLYIANHGDREAAEIFDIDVSGDNPVFTWVGTVLAPEDGFLDAIAWVPGTDGFLATSIVDPTDPDAGEKEMRGEPVGWVHEWQRNSGWQEVPGSEMESAPNGLIVSDDGSQIFVAASANFSVYRINRRGDPSVVAAKLDGFPDNVRWSADGKSILVGVHTEDMEKFVTAQIAAVSTSGMMYTSFNITRIDPETMETEIVMPSGVYGAFGAATGAIEVGNRLWVSSTGSDRVAIFDQPPQRSM